MTRTASAPVFACPPAGGVVVRCTGTSLTVRSPAAMLVLVAGAASETGAPRVPKRVSVAVRRGEIDAVIEVAEE